MKEQLARLLSAMIEDGAGRMAFRAACRREGVDPDKALLALRVAAGTEPMPQASLLAEWERESP